MGESRNRNATDTYAAVLADGKAQLEANGIEDAGTDAFYLFAEATGLDRGSFLLKKQEIMPNQAALKYQAMLNRRIRREPCQYITRTAGFMGLEFHVSPAVLIPRQDTELLCERAIECIKKLEKQTPSVLDLCTGSGALAVAIKYYCPEVCMTASDIAEDSLDLAGENAGQTGVSVTFVKSDMFRQLQGLRFDLIVSNPPYVTEGEYRSLMPEVREYEPRRALLAGADGLDFYKIIAKEAGTFLNRDGILLLEIGCSQAEAVKQLLEKNGFTEIRVLKDLNGLDRVIEAHMQGD